MAGAEECEVMVERRGRTTAYPLRSFLRTTIVFTLTSRSTSHHISLDPAPLFLSRTSQPGPLYLAGTATTQCRGTQ